MTLRRLQAEEKANLLKRKMQTLHQKKFTRQTASHATVKIMKVFRPSLKGVGDKKDVAEIKTKIEKGGNGMPSGLVPADKLDDMAEWVSKIK